MAAVPESNVLRRTTEIIESTLKIPAGSLDVDEEFDSYGMDSIIAMELLANLSREFSIRMAPTQFLGIRTTTELAGFIEDNCTDDVNVDTDRVSPDAFSRPDLKPGGSRGHEAGPFRNRSFAGLLDSIKDEYSIDLGERTFETVDDIVAELVSSNLDQLLDHYGLVPDPAKEHRENKLRIASATSEAGTVRTGRKDVAIVGMSCRFPDAPNPRRYWRNLIEKKSSIREIPASRWKWQDHYADTILPGRTVSKWAALIDDVECFDARFFDIPDIEAQLLDPQERLLCQEVYRAFQDAGIDAQGLSGSSTGVFIGYEYAEYEQALRNSPPALEGLRPLSSSSQAYYLANRLSYRFDLCGPSESININCASSAVAINRAYYALLNSECNLAVAGGVSLNLFADDYIALTQHGLLSPDGTCGVFDDKANGYTRGEGVAAIVLKRLEDAQRDNDRIYAVIKGCHQNNRGRAKSISDIKHEAITNVISDCYKGAGIGAESISYIEVSGYSTRWGDSFEFEGVRNAFSHANATGKHCALGSAKGNVGHMEPASGIASVIKVALSLHNRIFPPTIAKKSLSEFIDIDDPSHPLFIADAELAFENIRRSESSPIRAGVSSFCDSGVNVHIVLEEHPTVACGGSDDVTPCDPQLFVLSARDRARLDAYARDFTEFLEKGEADGDFVDMVYTLQARREALEERLAIVAASQSELVDKLCRFEGSTGQSLRTLEQEGIYYGRSGQDATGSLSRVLAGEVIGQALKENLLKKRWQDIAILWVNGASVPWQAVWEGSAARHVSLPTYPFARVRHWIDGLARSSLAGTKPLLIDGHTEEDERGSEEEDERRGGEALARGRPFRGPRDELEEQLVGMWAEVLHREPGDLSLDDEFVDQGGHSLLATQLASRIRDGLGINVPLVAFFDVTTLAGVAEVIRSIRYQQESPDEHDADESSFEEGSLIPAEEETGTVVANIGNQIEVSGTGMTQAEVSRFLIDYNDTQRDYPRDRCIHQLFAEQVSKDPGKAAVVYGDEHLTYRELYDRSHELALYLQSLGVEPDSLVGLCVERSLDMMVGILGILQAGGAYVPLDPGYPESRLEYMLQDSRAAIVLTQDKLKGRLASVAEGTRVIALDGDWPEIAEGAAALRARDVRLREDVRSHHLAYVIYTSGSTGQPKGVMVEHRAVNRLVRNTNFIEISREDVFLQLCSLSFDVATFEIWGALLNGARLAVAPSGLDAISEVTNLVRRHEVSVLWITSGLFRLMARESVEGLSGLRVLLAGGDVVPLEYAKKFLEHCKESTFINGYGPTENTVFTTCYTAPRRLDEALTSLPIGTPIANTRVYVLDEQNNPQPTGVPGELHMAGDGLARGYLNRPDLTEEKFVPNPFEPGTRMYKSGDLVRWLPDGNLEFLGRMDTQVKIRGFRVEIGEIEARLNQHPDVNDSVVVAQGEPGNKHLIAFYLARGSADDRVVELGNEALRAHLKQALPDHMVPAAFVSLGSLPLTANGKVDRSVLERLDVSLESSQAYVAPRNQTEQQLVDLWARVLNLNPEKIGVNDNFFELGGHSLLATQLVYGIRIRFGVEVSLTRVFEKPTPAQLAQAVAGAEKSSIPPIQRADRGESGGSFPASFAQERLWFIAQMEPDDTSYNVPMAIKISGELDRGELQHALNLIIERHEALRTIFPNQDGRARQVILENLDFELEFVDLSHEESAETRHRTARALCQKEVAIPFDLATGPLVRGKLIKLSAGEHVCLLNMHHIVSDGWSIGVLLKELGSIMEALEQGKQPELPPLPIQYVDYSIWQRKWLEEGGVLERQLAYWKEKLAGVPESLDLATDYPRPGVQSFAGATHDFDLDAELTGQLRSLAEQQGCTLYMILLTAYKVFLHRYTGQEDICIGGAIANRQYGETEGLIGMFVNTLALRTRLHAEDTFTTALAKVKSTCLEAYDNQDAPFEKIVDLVLARRNMAMNPIFQIMIALQNVPFEPVDRLQTYPLGYQTSKLDQTIEFTETSEGVSGLLQYSTALYKRETIERMTRHFTALCRAAIAAPDARIGELDCIDKAERHQLLIEYNDTRRDYPRDRCIHQLFAEQVSKDPGKAAVVYEDEQLTYRELYDRSHELALYLQSLGIEPDSLVGLCVERSLDMMVGILGILQAGGAYVPLDPEYPESRLEYMLQDSRAAIVLTQDKLKGRLASVAEGTRVIALDGDWPEIAEGAAALRARDVRLREDVRSHHLAYVIYTSGSTGQPKGVMVEHRAVNRLVRNTNFIEISREDVLLQLSTLSFDAATFEIWGALLNGARLAVAPRGKDAISEITRLLHRYEVSVIFVTSGLFRLLAKENVEGLSGLRVLLTGGDVLPIEYARRFVECCTGSTFIHVYGPTENTTFSTYRPSRKRLDGALKSLPIGVPVANTRVYVLDERSNLQPTGVPGELHIAGDGLARGYLNRPDLTEEKFVPNPFEPGERMYKSGDLVRWLPDGNLEFLGRMDTQVKIRGFRVEMGEIEARLNQHPDVNHSVVVAQGEPGDKHLIAFYLARGSGDGRVVEPGNEALRAHLKQALPDHMVPAAFVSLESLPLTANGKVDRRALERADVSLESSQTYLAPRSQTERQLVDLWAQVLNLDPEKIGINDNFFELGGHSLLATQLVSRIRTRLAVELPLRVVLIGSTISSIAESIDAIRYVSEEPGSEEAMDLEFEGGSL